MHAGRGDATRALDYYVGLLMFRANLLKVIFDSQAVRRWLSGSQPFAVRRWQSCDFVYVLTSSGDQPMVFKMLKIIG